MSETFMKYTSITLLLFFHFIVLPIALLDKWVNDNVKQVAHVEYLESNIANYLRTYPNKKRYLDYVKSYHNGNSEEIVDSVLLCAYYNDLDPKLIFAIAASESSFNINAKSYVGAKGLLQVMPFWKDEIGHPSDNLHDLEVNLQYGSAILKIYLEKADHNLIAALARYNGSAGSTKYPTKILTQVVWTF